MNSKEFIQHQKINMPDLNNLKQLGYENDEIKEIKESYLLEKINNNSNKYIELEDLGILFTNYKIASLEIGMISFLEKPILKNEIFLIGKIEIDDLVFSTIDKSVYVMENSSNNILWYCSLNIEKFLSSLAIMTEHFSKVIVDETLYDNFSYLKKVAINAGKKAGGEKYFKFYSMLLGI